MEKSDWAACEDTILDPTSKSPLVPSETSESSPEHEDSGQGEGTATLPLEQKVIPQQETLDESFEKKSSASPKEDRGCDGYKVDNPPVDQPHATVTVLKDYEHNMLLLHQKQLKTQMRICSQLRGIRKSISEIPKAVDRLAAPITSLHRSMNNVAQGSHNMSIRYLGLNCEMVRANTSISQSLERLTEAFELIKSSGHEAEAAADVASHHTELQDSTEESPQGNANL